MRIGALKVKLQLLSGDTLAFGPGKADLLDAIQAHGSISAAGRALGMSYRRCWLLVDEMNRCFTKPLVETAPGGGNPRGAWLTDDGKTVLAAYRTLEAASAGLGTHEAYATLASAMLDRPRPAKQG